MTKKPPESRTIRGEAYDLVLLQVVERDQLGRPLVLKLHQDDRAKIRIDGGEEFITAFVHRDGMSHTVKTGKA